MFTKFLVVAVFAGILIALGSALVFLIRDRGKDSHRTARALTVRIGVSIGLFALLFVLYALGLIHPHGVQP